MIFSFLFVCETNYFRLDFITDFVLKLLGFKKGFSLFGEYLNFYNILHRFLNKCSRYRDGVLRTFVRADVKVKVRTVGLLKGGIQ